MSERKRNLMTFLVIRFLPSSLEFKSDDGEREKNRMEAWNIKYYLSFGGGVNSTALLLLLRRKRLNLEVVYVDHGCDWPETRDFVHDLAKKLPITILRPDCEGFDNLYTYCWQKKCVPSVKYRWCTDKFKIRPLRRYIQLPAIELIGLDASESHRADRLIKSKQTKNRVIRFPLIEQNIDREGCKEIIRSAGWSLPPKSGCWFCPFQSAEEWRRLRRVHPSLFQAAKRLEDRMLDARKAAGRKPLTLSISGRSLDMLACERSLG